MLMVDAVALLKSGRSPRGERGLKFGFLLSDGQSVQGSLPPRGAWIEMSRTFACLLVKLKSLPPRGAWIEIQAIKDIQRDMGDVAPPAGSVD